MEITLNLWKCVFPLVIAFPEEMKPSLICAQLYRWLHFLSWCVCVCLSDSFTFHLCGFNCWYSSTNRSAVLFKTCLNEALMVTLCRSVDASFFFRPQTSHQEAQYLFERPFLEAFCLQTVLGHQSLPVCGAAVLMISCYKCIHCITILNPINSCKLINLDECVHFDSPIFFYICQIIQFCSPDNEYFPSGLFPVQSAVWNVS